MDAGNNRWMPAGGGTQITALLILYCFGFIFGAFAISIFLGGGALDTAYNIRGANIIQSIFLFLIPTAVYSSLFADKKGEFLIQHPLKATTLIPGILAIFAILPFVETINYYNQLIPLPETIEAAVRQAMIENQKAYAILFEGKTTIDITLNIITVAVLPGIVEELFFRGCLQRSIIKVSRNPHTGIWVAAVIFSLLHFQIAGFFSRIILGALLGYLYYWTKNIWAPILVHIINNASIVLILQLLAETDFYKEWQMTDYSLGNAWPAALISLSVTSALCYLIYKVSPKTETTL